MKKIIFCLMTILFLSSQAIGDSSKNDINILYDIIFDIGIQDREAYYRIMDTFFNENIPVMGININSNDDKTITDYAVPIIIRDRNLDIIYHEVFTGSFKNDHSDVVKIQMNRPPIFTREEYMQ